MCTWLDTRACAPTFLLLGWRSRFHAAAAKCAASLLDCNQPLVRARFAPPSGALLNGSEAPMQATLVPRCARTSNSRPNIHDWSVFLHVCLQKYQRLRLNT